MRTLLAVFVLLLLPASASAAASLYLSPAQANLEVGMPQVVTLFADTGNAQGNAVDADISYDPALIAVSAISKDGSVLSTWSTEPSATGGTIRLSGWADQRFTGKDNVVVRFTVTPLSATQSSLQFRSGTLLSPDVQETNILTDMRGAAFSVSPARSVPAAPAPAATATDQVAATTTHAAVPDSPSDAPDSPPESEVQESSVQQASQAAAAGFAGSGTLLVIVAFILVIVSAGALIGFLFYRADHD